MARIDEHGERIPLTVADFNASQGTVTVVIQAVGKTTFEMMALREGDSILDFIGPLGLPSHIRKLEGTVVLVGGGLGVAPVYPATARVQARWATAPSRSSASATATWCSGRTSSASSATS